MTIVPLRFWMKFKECEIVQAGKANYPPYFCLNMLYAQDVLKDEYSDEEEFLKDKLVGKFYFYSRN